MRGSLLLGRAREELGIRVIRSRVADEATFDAVGLRLDSGSGDVRARDQLGVAVFWSRVADESSGTGRAEHATEQ